MSGYPASYTDSLDLKLKLTICGSGLVREGGGMFTENAPSETPPSRTSEASPGPQKPRRSGNSAYDSERSVPGLAGG
ncbi:pyoverdine sidechain peptide synthetase II, D-Asp-L-Thr component [Pseudomonas syringae pv. tomato T1]|nr:pyoverdine sidechain peptide synthetase II, D-Asp-L-Thr component [Pseudomonas syringae pv. tomato T1]